MRTVYEGGQAEIVEKKSRFIATVRPISSEGDAAALVAEMKKKYYDARHNCFAFVLGGRQEVTRCSDDGEPAQTAGRPILDVLLGEDVHDAAIVVTRYFGGVLLGTGGLVRAYQAAARAGLGASVVVDKVLGRRMRVGISYADLGRLQRLFAEDGVVIEDSSYAEGVTLSALVPEERAGEEEARITEETGGRASIERGGEAWFASSGGKVILF